MLTDEERLTKLVSDIKSIRARGQPKCFPESLKLEAVKLSKIFGPVHIVKKTELAPSLIYPWRKKFLSDNEQTLNITHCVIPNQELVAQKPFAIFAKNGIECRIYNEVMTTKIIGEFLK